MRIISFFYSLIFHEKITEDMTVFLKKIFYISTGTIIAALFSFIFNITAARVLNPSDYGTFALVQSIAMIIYIPMLLGFHTSIIKYSSENRDYTSQSIVISTAYSIVFFLVIVSISIYIIFQDILINVLSISKEIFLLALIFAACFVLFTLNMNTLNGIHEMKKYALFQSLNNFVLLISFLIFLSIGLFSYISMIFASVIAYSLIGCAIFLFIIRKYFHPVIDFNTISTLSKFSLIAGTGGLIFSLYTNVDRILLNHFFGVEIVGIYSAYYYSTFTILTFFLSIFITVFFPTVSTFTNKSLIIDKIDKIVPYIVGIGIPIGIFSGFILLSFFGEKYPIYFELLILFSIAVTLMLIYTIYAWLFTSEGIRGAKITLSIQIVIALINILLNFTLIPRLGLYGAVTSMILAFFGGITMIYYWRKSFFKRIT